MNKIIIFLLLITVTACDRKPFVEHKLKFEKISEDCKNQKPDFQMISNFGGERYVFEKCLPDNFKDEQVTSTRKGDTVVVQFSKTGGNTNVLYKLTLDIDSYPKYSFVTIDDETFVIGASK